MRILAFIIIALLSFNSISQEQETINWINQNAIEIEDADPDTKLINFNNNIPEKFANAKIFGFGEATHHGKEFFDIKAKFFKYLVKTQEIKAFIMEDSYPAEAGINEWISGGKGDIKTIADNFNIIPWSNQEVVELLEWIRDYNSDKFQKEQIRFYGMDIQHVEGINEEIRDFVKKYKVPVSEELLEIVDDCANKKVDYKNENDWGDKEIPKLEEIEQIILNFQSTSNQKNNQEFKYTLRALNYLIKYTEYLQNPKSEVRDLKMYENVKWIIENEAENGKAFIWAHNEHINNKEISPAGSGWVSVGGHLKEFYKDDYYSVYFDFGVGKVIGHVTRRNKPNYWDVYEIDKPFRKTYAKTLFKANKDIYFIDMEEALKNSDARSFFSDKKKQLLLGASGYSPKGKNKAMVNKKFSEICDGLIFIKRISVPNYDLNSK
ncbi:erythromycin esterase [Salegentibacter echinorum]|uniref:Erythromycin esterase n=1 Tax=Salegentibacter echinorum TaxID=1073325 RepID=A0A1M5DSU7_SALEC|nr:erythromycin esterase family protein [Salegentibacter echinorum]SHF69862.1 erythromycin esterase [Salegentibacter echinorum]